VHISISLGTADRAVDLARRICRRRMDRIGVRPWWPCLTLPTFDDEVDEFSSK